MVGHVIDYIYEIIVFNKFVVHKTCCKICNTYIFMRFVSSLFLSLSLSHTHNVMVKLQDSLNTSKYFRADDW